MQTSQKYKCVSKWHLFPIVIVSGYYVLSASGWVGANLMMHSGALGKEAQMLFSTLSATDQFFRAIQVVGILIASIMLVLLNSQTILAFRCILVGGVITTILSFADVKPQWGISFIGGIEALLVNAIAYSYVSWLMRKINNTQPPAPHETRKERGSGEPRICK